LERQTAASATQRPKVSATQVADSLLLLAPGFIYLKLMATFGEQHRRLEWEWVVWSLIAALPLAIAGYGVRLLVERVVTVDAATGTTIEVCARFALAILLGLLSAAGWRAVRRSKWHWAINLRRAVTDSAWDLVLDDATRNGFGVTVEVTEGDASVVYYGKVATFGYEAAGAEPWLYLRWVSRWEGERLGYVPLDERTDGLLFHKDEIRRLRFVRPVANSADD
jgi:hypothetical protein